MQVIVMTNNGKTYMFNNCGPIEHNTQGFSFEYVGLSTGVKRKCFFNYGCVCGYSTKIEKGA